MRTMIFAVGIAAMLCLATSVFSQSNGQAVYKKATELYKQNKYDSCGIVIRTYLKTNGNDPVSQHLVPLLIESSVRVGDDALARRLFQIFAKRYATSPYLPRLWYLDGVSLVKQKDYSTAFGSFSRALTGGVSLTVDSLVMANVQKVCARALTADEIGTLALRGDLHPKIVEALKYYEIAKLNDAGQVMRARLQAEDFAKAYPKSVYITFVNDLLSKLGETQKGLVQIGVLAPLSGYESDIGKQVLQGIQTAFDQYVAASGAKIKLVICDTRGSMIESAKKTKELFQEDHVPVILGPMLSQDAIVSAAMLMEKDVVMLSPTANDDGIAALGNNIFQMNTTLGMLGAKIARYAIDNLNISDFAIFTPSSQYASSLTEGFKLEVEKSGRQIVDIETYEEGTKDFKAQFDKLKAILLERKQQRTQLEKSLNGEAVPQAGKPESKPVDTTYEIGGLFLPVEAEDAVMLAPQVQFHKIKTQMLGSLGWHNAKTVEDGKEYVVNTLFSTNLPASAAAETKEFSDFKALYKIKYGTDPDRIAAMGYDAASLIIAALRDAGSQTPTPTQISQYLGKVKGYKGASGMVSFDPKEHVNSETAIMKIKDKQFLRVQ